MRPPLADCQGDQRALQGAPVRQRSQLENWCHRIPVSSSLDGPRPGLSIVLRSAGWRSLSCMRRTSCAVPTAASSLRRPSRRRLLLPQGRTTATFSLGRLLSGANLRELDPELPPCYERAGIELARVRIWPGMKALQLKLVLHSQDASCEWLPLEVTASADGGRALHSSGRMGETPRDGWRDVLYNFDLPDGVNAVRPGEPHPRAGVLAHRPRSAGGTSGRVRARRAHRRSIRKGPDAGRLRQARARCIREALDRTGPRPTEAPGASGVRDAEGHDGALPAGIAPRAAGITAEAHLHCPARFGPQRDVHAAASGRARPASGIDGRAFLPRGQHPPDRSAERDSRAGGPRDRYAVIRACFAW